MKTSPAVILRESVFTLVTSVLRHRRTKRAAAEFRNGGQREWLSCVSLTLARSLHVEKALLRDPAIVKGTTLAMHFLVGFMAFSCDQNNVAVPRVLDGCVNCLPAINDLEMAGADEALPSHPR